jgi:hypothetical protein
MNVMSLESAPHVPRSKLRLSSVRQPADIETSINNAKFLNYFALVSTKFQNKNHYIGKRQYFSNTIAIINLGK